MLLLTIINQTGEISLQRSRCMVVPFLYIKVSKLFTHKYFSISVSIRYIDYYNFGTLFGIGAL